MVRNIQTEHRTAWRRTLQALTGVSAALAMLVGIDALQPQAQAQLTMLHASGTNIVNANGNVVPLRGVNIGGWFIMEKWMTPLDSASWHWRRC